MLQLRRAQRRERRHGRGRRLPPFNLVALMDIFTILVFFLLVNSSDVQELSAPRSVQLPESLADRSPRHAPTVLITASEVHVDGRAVAELAPLLSGDATVTEALQQALAAGRDTAEDIADLGEITILGDRTIPYQVLKKVMAICADTGFGRISLAVLQKSNQGG